MPGPTIFLSDFTWKNNFVFGSSSDSRLSYIYFPIEKCGSQVFESTFSSTLEDYVFRARAQKINYKFKPKDRIKYLKEEYGDDVITESFKFTFVRHPADRFLSAYLAMSPFFGNPPVSLLDSYLNDKWDGKEDLWVAGRNDLSIDEKIYRFNKFCSLFSFPPGDPHFANYFYRLPTDLNDLDFVGKLESSNHDFEFICNKIFCGNQEDIEDSIKVYNKHREMQSSHHSHHIRENLNFREFYTDENYELILKMYCGEMEKFGYE